MKFWKTEELGFGETVIILGDDEGVFSVRKMPGGEIEFREECDGMYSVKFSKEDALKAVDELRAWIESQ